MGTKQLTPKNDVEKQLLKIYEDNHLIPFTFNLTTEKDNRDEAHRVFDSPVVYDDKCGVFKLTKAMYDLNQMWYIPPGGKMCDIKRARKVFFDSHDYPVVYFFPKFSHIVFFGMDETIYFVEETILKTDDLPTNVKLYIIPDKKTVEKAEVANTYKKSSGTEHFYWIPSTSDAFFVSEKEHLQWSNTSQDAYKY